METERDAAGNIHGILRGTDSGKKAIIMGSHLDTVPSGGLFDGAYGVAARLEVVRRLKEEGRRLRHTIELYGFNAEESNPLSGTFGSRAITGLVSPEQPNLGEALAAYGHTIPEIIACKRDFSDSKCYLELHIEQGDYLFNEHLNIGIVSGIVGIIRYKVTAIGHSNHAGTTMMKNRRDAMVGMAKLIVEADRCCREIDDTLVFTVGTINCSPGSANVIPGRVECTFEMRHMDRSKTDELIRSIEKIATEIKTVRFSIEKTIDKGAVYCDKHLMDTIEEATKRAGATYAVMSSGAGHDANPMAHCIPIGMIFVPSRNGLSHCGEEWTDPEDTARGADILYQTILSLDTED